MYTRKPPKFHGVFTPPCSHPSAWSPSANRPTRKSISIRPIMPSEGPPQQNPPPPNTSARASNSINKLMPIAYPPRGLHSIRSSPLAHDFPRPWNNMLLPPVGPPVLNPLPNPRLASRQTPPKRHSPIALARAPPRVFCANPAWREGFRHWLGWDETPAREGIFAGLRKFLHCAPKYCIAIGYDAIPRLKETACQKKSLLRTISH